MRNQTGMCSIFWGAIVLGGFLFYMWLLSGSPDLLSLISSHETNGTDAQYPYVCEITERLGIKFSEKQVYNERSTFLPKYIATGGETVESIAQNELGNTTRTDELIELNAHVLPEAPTLQAGTEILLPPKHTSKTSGKIAKVSGYIKEITPEGKWMIHATRRPNEARFARIKADSDTKIPVGVTIDDFKTMDCITAIYDLNTKQIYSLEHQE